MNAAQKKAWKMKLSEAAKLRWERKRKNLKKKEKVKGEKEGTWKAERTETNGIKFRYQNEVKEVITKEPIQWFTIEDVKEVRSLMDRLGKEPFLKLVDVLGN